MPLNNNVKLSPQADEEQFHRVFLNLSHNAQEAMSDDGESTLVANANGRVEVSLTGTVAETPEKDTGGISYSLFNTKPKGTGLGLSACQKIATKYGSIITAKRSAQPKNGAFRLPSFPYQAI